MASPRSWRAATTGATSRCSAAVEVAVDLLVDDALGGGDLAAPAGDGLVGEALEVVHVEQGDAGQAADRRVDVAGHGDVDDEQRPATPGGQDGLEVGRLEQRLGRPGGGQQDVGGLEGGGEVVPLHGPAAAAARPGRWPGPRCGWRRGPGPAAGAAARRLGHGLAHLAGPDHQRGPPGQRSRAAPAAMATAACDSEVVPRAMAVSDRTRLPASTAWRNSIDSTGPAAALGAGRPPRRCVTWRRISPSPSTAESSPGGHPEQVPHGRRRRGRSTA